MAKKFQQIAEAWDVLGDEEKRKQYDIGQYNMETKNQKQANHAQRKEMAKQMIMGNN